MRSLDDLGLAEVQSAAGFDGMIASNDRSI
jgi:hypothetical protein